MEFWANLHLHSVFSDGVLTPEELAVTAKNEGYRAVALTDHDTVAGCEAMRLAAQNHGLEWMQGCEFTVEKPHGIHVTAYEFDAEQPRMKEYLEALSVDMTRRTREVFEMARARGAVFGLDWDDVKKNNPGVSWFCHEHVRIAFEKTGVLPRKEYQSWFAANFKEQRKLAPAKYPKLLLKDLVELIHSAGGIAVFAHPMYHLKYIDEILEAGIDGIEVWHPDQKQPEAEMSLRIAEKHGLYVSGGSDHSGLCGGSYGFYSTEKELLRSGLYIPEHCCGTTEEHFRRMKERRRPEARI